MRSKRQIFRLVWFSLVAVFMAWNWSTFQARGLPLDTWTDNRQVTVTEDKNKITFRALAGRKAPEVIFFQGGLVDPKAYGPLCKKLAENGFTTHLIKMAWRFPQYDYQKVSRLFDLRSGQFIIGGHSQGGKMAAQFVYENPGVLKGLFLMATSHPRDIDLSGLSIPVIKFYGDKDGMASVAEVLGNKAKLPDSTRWILIKGGNHSQFGYLGQLLGDDKAEIPLETQQQIVCDNLLSFLNAR